MKTKWRAWLFRIVLVLLVGMALVYFAGQMARNRLAAEYPAPGKMISAKNHKLHVYCEGEGPVTVFLVAGLNEFSLQWSQLQPLLARETKTCSYDRAGLGWSEVGDNTPTIDNSVADMREVLKAVGEHTPIVLVGHSYGAILVRMYVQRYPENIKAIVLLDPASEYMPEQIAGYAGVLDSGARQFQNLATMASLGLIAFSPEEIPAGLLKGKAVEQYRAVLASGNFFKAASTETAEMINNLHAMARTNQQYDDDIPVVIISRGQPEPIPGLPNDSATSLEQTWSQLQTDLVEKMHAKQIIAEKSGHSIQLTQPLLVFAAIHPFIGNEKE